MRYFIFFFLILSLQSPVCILYLLHISVWISTFQVSSNPSGQWLLSRLCRFRVLRQSPRAGGFTITVVVVPWPWVPGKWLLLSSLLVHTLMLSSCFSLPTAFTTGGYGADCKEAEALACFPPAASLNVTLLSFSVC